MKRIVMLPPLIAALAVPTVATAESVELTPFYGYRFGGDVRDTRTGDKFRVDSSPSWGATLDIPLRDEIMLELLYSRQDSDLGVTEFGGQQRDVDIEIEYFQVGALVEFDQGEPIVPYVTGSLGFTRFDTNTGDVQDATEFSITGGGGMKYMPNEHVGIRVEGRAYFTFVGSRTGVACSGGSGGGSCAFAFSGNAFVQGEVSAGLILAF